MDIQEKFEGYLREEVDLLNQFEESHFKQLEIFYTKSQKDHVVNKDELSFNKLPFHTTLYKEVNNKRVKLGTLLNWTKAERLDLIRHESMIRDDRLRRLIDFDYGWIDYAVVLQRYLDEGNVIPPARLLQFEDDFIHNIKHPTRKNDFLGIKVIKECETYILMKDESGIRDPDILRAWELSSIPEVIELDVDGVVTKFSLRKEMIKRIQDEAPVYFFCNPYRYAVANLDPHIPEVKLWLEYFIGSEDFFGFSGPNVKVSKSLLAAKRFEVVVNHLRKIAAFELDVESVDIMKEWINYIMIDPVYRSYKNRGAFGNLNQHVFARTKSEGLSWSLINIGTTNFELKPVKKVAGSYVNKYNLVDDTLVEESLKELHDEGLHKMADVTRDMISADITPENVKKGKLNRIALSYCGYTGSHSATAMVKQFNGTKDLDPNCDPVFIDIVKDNMKVYMQEGLQKYPQGARKDSRLDILFKGGTSSASSTNEHAAIDGRFRYSSELYQDKDVNSSTVYKTSNAGRYRVVKKISSKLKSKNANIMTHPHNFIGFKVSDLDVVVNAGSRLVRGTRAKRIITPNYGTIYASSLMTVLPAVRLLSSRASNMGALSTQGRIGTTYHGALPHDVMAPQLAVTSSDDVSKVCVAKDFGQFDTSQWGQISKAHSDGVRVMKNHYSMGHDGLVDLDLRDASFADLLEVTAMSFEKPLKYKMNGLVCESAGVKSGELTTQTRNTTTNISHSTVSLDDYNNRAYRLNLPKLELVTDNKVGDDSVEVLRIVDGSPLTPEIAKLYVNCMQDHADKNHLEISAKRTIVGNNVAEHIKIWVFKGYLALDVFLDSVTSEKNSFSNLNYLEQVNILYDMAMTLMIRYCSVQSCMTQFCNDMKLLNGIRAGNFTFIPNPKIICAYGTPEICLRAPEIRAFGRYLPIDIDEYAVLNDLVASLSTNRPQMEFVSQMIKQNGNKVDKLWTEHFRRKNDINPNGGNIYVSKGLKRLMPEHCEDYLNELVYKTLDEKVIRDYASDIIITNVCKGKLSKAPKLAFYADFYLSNNSFNGFDSPYITADEGVKNVHRVLGLSYRNTLSTSPTSNVDRILRNNPGSAPAYLTGNDIFGVLSDYPSENWRTIVELLDITEPSATAIIDVATNQMHAYLADKDLNTANLFDNTSRTYDISDRTYPKFVNITSHLSRSNMSGFSIEAMKHVIYMARRGVAVMANPHPQKIGNTVYYDY
uniref:RNA-directed RNA polymerase n=1 Tax=Banna virus TaxID=77763 RepID=A0A3G2KX52_BANNV|nr:VP1 [Banna virus]